MSASKPKAHVQQYKKDTVARLVTLFKTYPIVGIVNMQNMPSSQLGGIKKSLRGKAVLFMTKRRFIKIAIEQAKVPGIETLLPLLKGMPAFLFTKDNPFALYKTLKKSKSPAPAKAGAPAPRDIIVPAGPTPFTPGPVTSELAAVGIKAGVEGGKVAVKADSLVCKEGEPFKPAVAAMLTRLSIFPMEIGIDMTAAYEKGVIYGKDVLDVDEKTFLAKITTAAQEAFNLAVEAKIVTKDTIELLLQTATRHAHGLVLESSFPATGAIEELLALGEREAMAVKDAGNIQ